MTFLYICLHSYGNVYGRLSFSESYQGHREQLPSSDGVDLDMNNIIFRMSCLEVGLGINFGHSTVDSVWMSVDSEPAYRSSSTLTTWSSNKAVRHQYYNFCVFRSLWYLPDAVSLQIQGHQHLGTFPCCLGIVQHEVIACHWRLADGWHSVVMRIYCHCSDCLYLYCSKHGHCHAFHSPSCAWLCCGVHHLQIKASITTPYSVWGIRQFFKIVCGDLSNWL